jgi:hypothetical protein
VGSVVVRTDNQLELMPSQGCWLTSQ